MSNTERLLRELIALPSVNPAFLPAGDARAGEHRIANFLASLAAGMKLDVELQAVLPDRPNLLVRLPAKGKPRQRILLAPHLDTVPAADDSQFAPTVRNGRLFGRGACDTKGSVAAMLTALAELAAGTERPNHTEIIFAGLVDEENAQAGSRALVASGFKANVAIIGEPTLLKIVTAHKGSVWLQLVTRGKSAHGALPQLGRNAVHQMARIVDALETDYAALLRKRRHTLLGTATVNTGTICGGTQPNIVPDSCVISVDRRTLPGETETSVRGEIAAFLRKRNLKASFGNAKLAPCPPMETDPGLPLVRDFLKSVGQRSPAGVHFFCDAAVLAEAGIPSIIFGPGDIAQGHTVDEWISLQSLERATDILVNYLRSLP